MWRAWSPFGAVKITFTSIEEQVSEVWSCHNQLDRPNTVGFISRVLAKRNGRLHCKNSPWWSTERMIEGCFWMRLWSLCGMKAKVKLTRAMFCVCFVQISSSRFRFSISFFVGRFKFVAGESTGWQIDPKLSCVWKWCHTIPSNLSKFIGLF